MIRNLLVSVGLLLMGTAAFGQVLVSYKTKSALISKAVSSLVENLSETGFSSSNLPIVVINTDNGAVIIDDPKITAHMGIIDNGPGNRNTISDAYTNYNGTIGIELRGNSTQDFPKKPYNFETRDNIGANLDVSLLGLPKENDWVLSASYVDHTFIRNPLASHLSQLTGRWASHCLMVEVVLNGNYQGIYILMESIKRDKNRLNIAKLDPAEITSPDITGGYIWEVTGFENNMGYARNLKYPKYDEAAPAQRNYIIKYDNNFRSVMNSTTYKDETTGYSAWIDVPSFVDELIVQEATRNSDAYGWSSYFHKDMNQKINAGPVWDFDQSAGNSSYPDDGVAEGWMFKHQGTMNTPFFWKLLFDDPVFSYKVKLRWTELRKELYKTDNINIYIDSIANYLSEAQSREFAKWPVLGKYVWRETSGFQKRTTYKSEVEYLKGFLKKRFDWMDTELAKIQNPNPHTSIIQQFENGETLHVYPNPAADYLVFEISSKKPGKAIIQMYNYAGKLVQSSASLKLNNNITTYKFQFDPNLKQGFYLYKIVMDDRLLYAGKVIKRD